MTIQVGGFANFIGSHFWNFQVELIRHDYASFFVYLVFLFLFSFFFHTSPLWLINICSSLKYFRMVVLCSVTF